MKLSRAVFRRRLLSALLGGRFDMTTEAELKQALHLAADALAIVNDWNLYDVQIDPPPEWSLYAEQEDTAEGWCSTLALANKLRELAA